MRTEVFYADTIDEAADVILRVLKKSINSRDNVFYFDGWDGLGASAVLRAVAQRLTTTSPAGFAPVFEQLIHIDCSKWESRRALQRAVAEQLDLPAEVMEMFDREDEDDDFRGVSQGSRVEVQQIVREMQQRIQTRRFLVIFHNGSSEEVDLASCCGFPLSGYSTNKVLWTFQGRFRVKPRMKVDMAIESAGTTDIYFLSPYLCDKKQEDLWSQLILQEAAEVVAAWKVNTGFRGIIDEPSQVAECFQYMLELCCRGSQCIDYDLNTHGANYWVCDGIIHQPQQGERNVSASDGDDRLWRSAEALQREMPLDVDYHRYLPSPHLLARFFDCKPYWTSPTCGFTRILDGATPNTDMFPHYYYDKLSVLKLSGCTFDLQSPPFLCCHSLRFLWLDHCQINGTNTYGAGMEGDVRRCFQRLWVLDVRYTSCDQILSAQMLYLMTQLRELNVMGAYGWDMGQLQGRLPNIRKLRVTNSYVSCSCSENDLLTEMNKMELFEFSGSSAMTSLSGPGAISNNSSLETVIINDENLFKQISFRGCTQLKNILLKGWIGIRTLDISGTAVKTLDLTATTIQSLDDLHLLGCEKLCAILWPPEDKRPRNLDRLCIGTTQTTPTARYRKKEDNRPRATGTSAALVQHSDQLTSEFDWYISVRDARLLVSLEPVYSSSRKAYVEVSSPTTASGGSNDEGIRSRSSRHEHVNLQRHPGPTVYADITVHNLQQQDSSEEDDDAGGIMWMWPCPGVPPLPQESCYMHIQDQTTRTELSLPRGGEQTSGTTITAPLFLYDCAKILHVHDSMSITSTPSHVVGSEWPNLEWCRIERCPRLDFVFHNDVGYAPTYQLRTFWASQLLKSRYISTLSSNGWRKFPHLTFLHLDLCPRLIHALSWEHEQESIFGLLETIEIVWCGDLREILSYHTRTHIDKPKITIEFTKLKHIHLHELPSLQSICGVRVFAPNLETVKIRGCWSLTRLPDVGSGDKVVECDCEKEWWDRLEWDDGSQASRYKPIHSRYYKKTLLRGSVLR